MASGKTTFGKSLAQRLNIPFIDLDEYIEEKSGSTIKDLFQKEGEAGFRKIEKEMLREAAGIHEKAVIACGGGTPCHHDNMQWLNENGITVFMETSTPVLISRLIQENSNRPIMADKSEEEITEKVLSQLRDRLPVYLEAKLKWSGDELETREDIEENVENFITSYPSLFR